MCLIFDQSNYRLTLSMPSKNVTNFLTLINHCSVVVYEFCAVSLIDLVLQNAQTSLFSSINTDPHKLS